MVRSPSPATYRQDELFGGARLPVMANVVELNGELEAHAHDFLEVAVVSKGAGAHVTSAGVQRVRAGEVFVLRPGAWHAFVDCRQLEVANCCLGTAAPADDLALLHAVPELRDLLWTAPVTAGRQGVLTTSVGPSAARDAVAGIRALAADLGTRNGNRVLLLSRLLAVLGALTNGRQVGDAPTRSRPPAVDVVLRALDDAPDQPWTVARMAALINLDPAYLSRLFRQHVGLPPVGYLARLRIERASVLLSHSDVPIAHVAAAVGWPDPNYFARRFRTLSGLSPTAYRTRAQGGATELHPESGAVNAR